MEIRLTRHAYDEMRVEELEREDLAEIIELPERLTPGETADEYYRTVRGTLYRVIVVKGSDPPLVITVHQYVGQA